jgi:TatA/E family protein of Tat protein translocase
MPFGIQPIHIIIVAIVALIIFGPSRLPELGRSLGKSITEFRKGMKEMTDGMREEMHTPDQSQAAPPAQSVPGYPAYPPPQPMQTTQTPVPPQPVQTTQTPVPPQPVQTYPVSAAPQPEPGAQSYQPSQASTGISCPRCGTMNAPGARFCNQCGASLS